MKRFLTVFFSFMLIAMLGLTSPAKSQDDEIERIKSSLPKMLGANNVGKEFYFAIPPCFEDESAGYANFIKIFITSASRTLVTVDIEGSGYYLAKMTIPNDVIEYNITPVQAQPYTKMGRDPNVPERTFPGRGIHITADQPLVVYVVIRYRYTSDGFLAIPVSSLGKEYIVAGWNVDAMFRAVWNYKLPNICTITAAYNDTRVRFTLGGNSFTKTAGGMKPGESKEFILNKGDVWAVAADTDEGDLSGSKVIANKPIAVVTGNMCNNIPTGNQWCDYTVEMDIPTFTWGTDYHIPIVPGRKYPSIIRIFAKEPNTTIYRNGRQIGQIKQAGGMEGNAYLTMRMGPMDVPPASIVMSGDKPIGVTLYNTGVQEDNYVQSDPFVMVMTPFQQYQKEITFCTPGIMGGQAFAMNWVNLVYETDELGMMSDDFEFARVNAGKFEWVKLKARFPGIDEMFPYAVQGKNFARKTITLPGDGVYKIRSEKLFAAYSFGYDSYDSYGFPTSAALADLEKPDTNCPVPTYVVNCDGSVKGAQVKDMPDDDKIRSNLAMIVMDDLESFNYTFKYIPFIAGETRTTSWELTVIDPEKDAQATITFADRVGNDTTIVIKYSAIKLAIEPNRHDFGQLQVGSQKVSQDFNVINLSTTSPVLINEIKLKKNDQNFELDLLGVTLPQWLGPQQKLPFKAWFDPMEMGEFIDSIGVGDTCFFWYKAEVRAKVSEPEIDVTDIDFGTRSVIDPVITKEFTITNNGKSELTITRYQGPSRPEYRAYLPPADANGYFVTPIKLQAGQFLKYNVDFKPTTVNTFPDQIVFSSDATKTDSICVINGRSIEPGLRTRDYDWKKVRIDRPAFPRGPYTPSEPTVWFYNDGSQDVTITDVVINVVKGDGAAFKYNLSAFYNLVVPSGDSVVVPVTFQPTSVGEYEVHMTFVNNANISDVTTKLLGIGILPRLQTFDYAFGTTVVNDYTDIQTNQIVFTNLNYQFEDTVYIQDLVMTPAGGIREDLTGWGTEGFRYDKAALSMPVLLQPGESLTFDAEFVAAKLGAASATLTTVSEAEQDVTSTWTGNGFTQDITLTGGSANICVGSIAEITCTIVNSGSGTITVGPLYLDRISSYFGFKQPNPFANPVDIPPGEARDVVLVFSPTNVVNERVYLMVPTSIQGKELDSVAIDIASVHYDATTTVNVLPPNLNRPWPQIGDAIPVNIVFNRTNGNIAMAQVTELDVVVRYNGGILKIDRNSIRAGASLNGFQIRNEQFDDQAGYFSFNIYSPTNQIINVDGEIATFTFGTFLPTSKDTTDFSILSQVVSATGNLCLDITNTPSSVKLQPTCAYDLRWIATTGVQYGFNKIAPNPVEGGSVSLDFSVGLEAWTDISIYNTRGDLVAMPVAGILKPGAYTVDVPTNELSSGAYMIKMVSGPFTKTQELIIRK